MNFELDVFVSYAHLDDAALIEGKKGWVENLGRRIRVGMFPRQVLRRTRSCKATTCCRTSSRSSAKPPCSSRSPRHRSESTTMELTEFCRARQIGGLQVRTRPIAGAEDASATREQSQAVLAEFFAVIEGGKVREFDGARARCAAQFRSRSTSRRSVAGAQLGDGRRPRTRHWRRPPVICGAARAIDGLQQHGPASARLVDQVRWKRPCDDVGSMSITSSANATASHRRRRWKSERAHIERGTRPFSRWIRSKTRASDG